VTSESEVDEGPADPKPTRKRWRDDPLSVFLAVSAVLLGIMYFLEQSDIENLEEASALAHRLGVGWKLDGCTFGSAGTDGETLVVSCDSTAADAATRARDNAYRKRTHSFRTVVFIGTDAQLECKPRVRWPENCEKRDKPQAKSRAKRLQ